MSSSYNSSGSSNNNLNKNNALKSSYNSNQYQSQKQQAARHVENYKNKDEDAIQFRVLSKSPNKNKNNQKGGGNYNSSNYNSQLQNNPYYENVYDVMGKPHQTQKLNQVVMNESSDIFNDGIYGGGVEPSINESIRQSIQCSFVSSECNETKQKYQQIEQQPSLEAQRSLCVMNRMNWITYLKVLFDQLESFNQNKQKHVETVNFLKGFKKIKHLLPLQTRNEYFKSCSEVAFSYKEVENGVGKMPSYITWDNIIDVFLTNKQLPQTTQNLLAQNVAQPKQSAENSSKFRMNNIFSTQIDTNPDSEMNTNNTLFTYPESNPKSQKQNENQQQVYEMPMNHHQRQPNHKDDSQIVSDVDFEEAEIENSNQMAPRESNVINQGNNYDEDDDEDDGYPITQIQQDIYVGNSNNKRHQRGLSSMGGAIQVVQTNSFINTSGGGTGVYQHQRNLSKPNVIPNKTITGSVTSNSFGLNAGLPYKQVGVSSSGQDIQSKQNKKRNDDFYPSFADSLINYGGGGGSMVHGGASGSVGAALNYNYINQSITGPEFHPSMDMSQHQNMTLNGGQQHQQYLAQAPLTVPTQNPILIHQKSSNNNEDDEACEIDSEYSNSRPGDDDNESDDHEDSKAAQNNKGKRKLEESIRSSRTATFKSARRTSTAQNQHNNSQYQHSNYNHSQQQSLITNALTQAVNVQDSYYATIKNSTMQQQQIQFNNHSTHSVQNQVQSAYNSRNPNEPTKLAQSHQKPSNNPLQQSANSQTYYNLQNNSMTNQHLKIDSRQSSQNRFSQDMDDGQVEVASNHSYGSSKWRNMDNQNNSRSVRVDLVNTFEDHQNHEKSTRISSMNSIQKSSGNQNQNKNYQNGQSVIQTSLSHLQNSNTIISHSSSQSSQSQNKFQNNSKLGAQAVLSSHSHISQSSGNTSSSNYNNNFLDLDLSSKGLKTFDIDSKQIQGEKRQQIRSLNLSINSLVKMPCPLEKTIIYINVSFNKLKSLNGIEICVNLKFLNVSGNQLSSANNLVILQSMRELIFAYNQLSILKEIGQLKNLQLLDLSHNKISEIEKIMPLQSCKRLSILSLQGNIIEKLHNYDSVLKKMLPQVKVQDPDQIKDFSQFTDMEHICFTDPPFNNPNHSQLIMVEQMSQMNLRQPATTEKEKESNQDNISSNNIEGSADLKPRSRTPNRERAKSQIGVNKMINNQNGEIVSKNQKQMIISPQREDDRRTSNINKNNTSSSKYIYQQQKINKSPVVYNESQFKMQSKYSSSNAQNNGIQAANHQIGSRPQKGAITYRNQGKQTQLSRERSQNNDFHSYQLAHQTNNDRSQTRQGVADRSTSNISRNAQSKAISSASGLVSGRSTAQQQSSNNQTLNSQYTTQSVKDPLIKKVSLNQNATKFSNASQGKITPRRTTLNGNNIQNQTPRQEKPTHYYKKSFSQNEEEQIPENQPATPQEKTNFRTSLPTQDSSNKKYQKVTKIVKKDPTTMNSARNHILSPNTTTITRSQVSNYQPPQSSRNSNRPVTNLKQRLISGAPSIAQQDSSYDNSQIQQNAKFNNTTNLAAYQAQNLSGLNHMPQSAKNQQKPSHSFVFENPLTYHQNNIQTQNNTGRQTPNSNNNGTTSNLPFSSNRPSSQLQKFIIASQKPNQNQAQITVTTSRPSTSQTQMSIHSQVPSQKLTNLPPRAYQMKTANPGDKKSQADMSLSVISNGNQNSNPVSLSIANTAQNQGTAASNISQSQIQNTSMHSTSTNKNQQHNNISQSQNPLSLLIMNSSSLTTHPNQITNTTSQNLMQNTSNFTQFNQSKQINNNYAIHNEMNMMMDHSSQNMVLQDSRHFGEDFTPDCNIDSISSRSMSPVLEESNNIKKLKVDLTQYMNKQ